MCILEITSDKFRDKFSQWKIVFYDKNKSPQEKGFIENHEIKSPWKNYPGVKY